MPDPSHNTGYLKLTAFYIITLGALLVFVESLASVAPVLRDMVSVSAQSLAEPRHTKYEPDLGWVSEPSVDIPDMYAPGVYLRTNRQGFRSNQAVATAVPPLVSKALLIEKNASASRDGRPRGTAQTSR